MDLIEKLNKVSTNTSILTSFLQENINSVYDFFLSQGYSELKEEIERIDNYIFSNYKVLKKIDLSVTENLTFITVLLDVCERFGFLSYFKRLYKLLVSSNSNINSRHKATALFSIGIKEFSDYEKVFEEVLNKLQYATEYEEDNYDKVVSTFVDFYAQVVYNYGQFNCEGVLAFRNNIKKIKCDFFFLGNALIDEILLIDVRDFNSAYDEINLKLDLYLNRKKVELIFSEEKYLIESETEYSKTLKTVPADFHYIRNISVENYNHIGDNDIFYSLGRGVEILTSEKQLFAYMNSYGNMHYAKLDTAFNMLPDSLFSSEIEIYDWGCGQAMASLSYLDFLKKNDYRQKINKITLNEPSELALKRGSLHLNKFDKNIDISTINKDLDSLKVCDFNTNGNIKLHFFSNILDIDFFSMDKLTSLIQSTFKGVNYFVIVSPYITEIKRNRIDNFVRQFEENNEFELIDSLNKQKREWKNNWTIVSRVFKVDL
ncbi:hypothetical protein [Lutibacter flavus]|uniref:Methyltransferase domain-containing protein n=1 Tax=Lutibacter flavus TaxID=691689 RepID=A0A238VIJ3_9FLAO|nr:hypothetical protein [Lutibacter flavus]SNR33937.1 hypothetical protein SAMN04488111_0528 [Lutibacter flavus]